MRKSRICQWKLLKIFLISHLSIKLLKHVALALAKAVLVRLQAGVDYGHGRVFLNGGNANECLVAARGQRNIHHLIKRDESFSHEVIERGRVGV